MIAEIFELIYQHRYTISCVALAFAFFPFGGFPPFMAAAIICMERNRRD